MAQATINRLSKLHLVTFFRRFTRCHYLNISIAKQSQFFCSPKKPKNFGTETIFIRMSRCCWCRSRQLEILTQSPL